MGDINMTFFQFLFRASSPWDVGVGTDGGYEIQEERARDCTANSTPNGKDRNQI